MLDVLNPPLKPRDGQKLRVLIVARVSSPGEGKQDIRSLDDQEANQRRWLDQHTELPTEIKTIAGQGSGERTDRPEYQELIDEVQTGRWDLVLVEKLDRISRRMNVGDFCELCEDRGTRLIAPTDRIDTWQRNWRDPAFFSGYFSERENREKSERIKARLQARFQSGGALPCEVYGYHRPAECRSEADLQKDPEAEAIYHWWFDLLDRGGTFAEVARGLNEWGVPVPPHAKNLAWDGRMVSRHTYNPILKGQREHNNRKTRRVNSSGRWVSFPADPSEKLIRQAPHLAFFSVEYYDRVTAKLKSRNGRYRRAENPDEDPLKGRPKKATRWPGQHIRCGICGRLMLWGGHGRKDHLMCKGAREKRCWNSGTVDGPKAAKAILAEVHRRIDALPGFDEEARRLVEQQVRERNDGQKQQREKLSKAIQKLEGQIEQLLDRIEQGSASSALSRRLAEREGELAERREQLQQMAAIEPASVHLPDPDELRRRLAEKTDGVDLADPTLRRAMALIVPAIHIIPYRLHDGGAIVPRAQMKIRLTPLVSTEISDISGLELDPIQEVECEMPLHEPNPGAEIIDAVCEHRSAGPKPPSLKATAKELGVTVRIVKRAIRLAELMNEAETDSPYQRLTQPPKDDGRLRAHRHPAYRFEPLAGFPLSSTDPP